MLGHQLFEVFEGLRVEAPQVVVEDVDARHAAAGQVHEQRVGREHLQVEHALAAGHRQVEQQLHLRAHRVDDARARLEVPEATAKLAGAAPARARRR